MTDIMTPALGESVTEATVSRWAKKAGEAVKKDELLVELETDKVALEVVAPEDGVLSEIAAPEGETVTPGAVLGRVTAGAAGAAAPKPAAKTTEAKAPEPKVAAEAAPKPAEVVKLAPALKTAPAPQVAPAPHAADLALAPSVARIVEENRLDPSTIAGTGKDGRITKGDALAAVELLAAAPPAPAPVQLAAAEHPLAEREERVRMTRLRQTIARRLKEAQNAAAMLTTFNEVDMSAVMALRNTYKDAFEKRHGVRLGFMSVFVKACVAALKDVPEVNAEIDGQDLIYKNHYDIGVAVGTDRGLVVPVVRDCDVLNLAGIEKAIGALGKKARDGQLAMEDLQGGTFTISNGGVYGSLMSTPILNAPQSGILGMHKIQDRPMVVGGQVVIRPMMYLALSYDHRVVDGQGAVTFLVKVKEHIEDPQRLLLDI
ncbi:MAG TPA: 2-oxoglutarate dehydrogenase complex dihydrolipoyllysine-residue succinyltransferase [Caulobacteraceae bacterium]|jgi:2-oxoglutarate dehydrogenase E2 component (dihydrolipoamide succinyltransferase)|nr:2-oxoglutarate dehydrogenase complex dihydrolipoyllysine-residue succinyltransferase [Caulobacteraceae bacterium]